jgi:mono/diheme cytochrome c family protein
VTSTKLIAVVAGLCGLTGSVLADNAPSAIRGKQLYFATGCVHCHGSIGQGSQAGPRLAPNPPSAAAMTQIVRATNTNMPAYPVSVLDDTAIADIVAFLTKIKPGRAADRIPALNGLVDENAPAGPSPSGK